MRSYFFVWKQPKDYPGYLFDPWATIVLLIMANRQAFGLALDVAPRQHDPFGTTNYRSMFAGIWNRLSARSSIPAPIRDH
ncbi:MAG: hypothetical protein ACNA7E_09950 [Wenzhouxiangellaceae bacterium]